MLSDRLGCSAWLRSDTCPSYSDGRVGRGRLRFRFLHRRHVKGGSRGSRGSPKEQHYLSSPSETLLSGSPTRIGLTYPQLHRRPYSSYACSRSGYFTAWCSCPAFRPSTTTWPKGGERQSCISVLYGRRCNHDSSIRPAAFVSGKRRRASGARSNNGDQDMV